MHSTPQKIGRNIDQKAAISIPSKTNSLRRHGSGLAGKNSSRELCLQPLLCGIRLPAEGVQEEKEPVRLRRFDNYGLNISSLTNLPIIKCKSRHAKSAIAFNHLCSISSGRHLPNPRSSTNCSSRFPGFLAIPLQPECTTIFGDEAIRSRTNPTRSWRRMGHPAGSCGGPRGRSKRRSSAGLLCSL